MQGMMNVIPSVRMLSLENVSVSALNARTFSRMMRILWLPQSPQYCLAQA